MKAPCLAALLLVFAPLLHAQEENPGNPDQEAEQGTGNTEESQGPRRFWQANLPGGHYMVALDRISSISLHDYLLSEGGVVVTEVTVNTNGRVVGRFYHLEPVTDSMELNGVKRVVERGRELIERAGQRASTNLHEMAQKTYPSTTHAGTVEYRVLDVRDLQQLYGSLLKSWESGRGRKFTIK